MSEHLAGKDSGQIVFGREFREYGDGGTASGILEVYGVAQVYDHTKAVYGHEYPLCNLLPNRGLLVMQRNKHEQDIERVGVKNG